jgi:transglutaminase-like putative cysteine protease
MKSFGLDCELNYESAGSTTYLFNIAARNEDRRQIVRSESVSLIPHLPFEEFSDGFGNRYFRIATQGGPFSIRYVAEVDVLEEAPPQGAPLLPAQLPPETLLYLLPSRYCECDRVFGLAASLFCGYETQRQCVDAICAWIRANIRYRIGTSLPHGSAWDVLQTRTGVCRDFAHVAVALCRAMNIPTRFVTAHARWNDPPPDFHALIECHADGRWQLIDPTAMADVDNVVCIGKGLDAAQVPFATIYGSYRMTRMSPLVVPLGAAAQQAPGGLSAPPEQLALAR